MDVLHAYALLRDACRTLDETGDHAVAAYVGHGMALLETKYGIDPDAIACSNVAETSSSDRRRDGGSGNGWA